MYPILHNSLKLLFHFAFACIVFLSIHFLAFLVITVFLPLKGVVLLWVKLFKKDLLNTLSGATAYFATENVGAQPEINILVTPIFDGPISLENLRSSFQQRILECQRSNGKIMYPEFKQYWTSFMNYSFWVKEDRFDLNEHIRLYDYGNEEAKELILDENQKGFCDEDDLNRVMGPLLQLPWGQGKSPWEFLLVENFKSSQRDRLGSAIIFRVHHTMGDGYSFLKILHRWMDVDYPKPLAKFPKKSLLEKFLFISILPFKLPWDLAASVMQTFDGAHCWTRQRTHHLTERKVWTSLSKPVDVKLIKSIKNEYGVGYNAVLNAAAAGSCMRLMEDAGQLIPKEMACFIPYPLPRHPDGLVNHVTSFMFKWAMDKKLNRHERLRLMSERMTVSKYNTAPLGNQLWTWLGHFLPNSFLSLPRHLLSTIVVTSFPGPQHELAAHGFGVKMIDLIASIGPGVGIGGSMMLFISGNGKQRFIKCIDSSIFPTGLMSANFGKYVEEELHLLLEDKTGKKKTN